MSPEAIVAAIKRCEKMVAWRGELENINEDYLLILIPVDGDSSMDFAILQNHRKLSANMKDGAFHKAPAL